MHQVCFNVFLNHLPSEKNHKYHPHLYQINFNLVKWLTVIPLVQFRVWCSNRQKYVRLANTGLIFTPNYSQDGVVVIIRLL